MIKRKKEKILERQNGVCAICFEPLFLNSINLMIHHFFRLLHLEEFTMAVHSHCHPIAEKLTIGESIKTIIKANRIGRSKDIESVRKEYNVFLPDTTQFFNISIPFLEYLLKEDKNEIDILYEYIYAFEQIFLLNEEAIKNKEFIKIPFFIYLCPNFRLGRFVEKNVFVFGTKDIIKQENSSFVIIPRDSLTPLDYVILKSYFVMTITSLISKYFSFENKKIEIERFIDDALELLPNNFVVSDNKIQSILNYFEVENIRMKRYLDNLVPVPSKPNLLYSPEGGFIININQKSIIVGSFTSNPDVVYPGYNMTNPRKGTNYRQMKDLCAEANFSKEFGEAKALDYFNMITKNTTYNKITQNGIWRRDYFNHKAKNIKYPKLNELCLLV